jgi:hypothetical protein
VYDGEVAPTENPWSSQWSQVFKLWGSDEIPRLPSDGSLPPQTSVNPPFDWPPPGGFRCRITEMLVDEEHVLDPKTMLLHQSDTVDVTLVLSGEISLELDDGLVVDLKAGDCNVQNGTRHAWHVKPGTEPLRIFNVLIGGVREER